jgi:5S rRNA maturation endonuclease (ribonuclease M5)
MFIFSQNFWFIDESLKDVPVVVEGKKDEKALQKLGFRKIFSISGKTLGSFVDKVVENGLESVIILTDFDQEGNHIASKLNKLFTSHDVHVNSFIRRKFQSFFKIHKVEELNSITKFMEDDYYGETRPINHKIYDRGRISSRRNNRKARHNRSDIWPD